MMQPKKIYFYKMTADNGGAPCVHEGMLSLAICKPEIRRTAQEGDLIFGFGGKRLGGRLIYAAFVTEKPKVGEYYRRKRFQGRPDCIYREVDGHPERIAHARYHFDSDESSKDVGWCFERAFVLLSNDFRYFGQEGTIAFRTRYRNLARAFDRLTQGHRVNHHPVIRIELIQLAEELWRDFRLMVIGEPSDADHTRRCNTGSRLERC